MDLGPLIQRWRGPVSGWFAARGADPGRAEDLAQDVFAEAYLARRRFRGVWDDGEAVGSWLRGIARNLWRSERRRARRMLTAPDAGAETVDPNPTPAEAAARSAERTAVRAAVAGLDQDLREVVWMFYFDDASTRDVAVLLDQSEKTVEGRLYRARKILQGSLAEFLETEVT